MKKIIFALLIMILQSCSKDIEIQKNEPDIKIVIGNNLKVDNNGYSFINLSETPKYYVITGFVKVNNQIPKEGIIISFQIDNNNKWVMNKTSYISLTDGSFNNIIGPSVEYGDNKSDTVTIIVKPLGYNKTITKKIIFK